MSQDTLPDVTISREFAERLLSGLLRAASDAETRAISVATDELADELWAALYPLMHEKGGDA